MAEFDGSRVLVTGAASGIGAAAARAFVREGARVMLADRDLDAAERLAAELERKAGPGRPHNGTAGRARRMLQQRGRVRWFRALHRYL